MQPKHVKIYAPATIANVGAGFDVLGIALAEPGDFIVAHRIREPGIRFTIDSPIAIVPGDTTNVAAHVAGLMVSELNLPFGIAMTLTKGMPIGSGLGSSGASCAAAAVAVNELLEYPLPRQELIRFAVEGERLASGHPHADNVAPAILGGACLIASYHPLEIIELPLNNVFYWAAIHPDLIVHTKTARDLLPETIPLRTAVEQWGHVGALVAGLITGNPAILQKSFCDVIAEPVRAPLIPGYFEAKAAALRAGALGFSISGSGPSVFTVSQSLATAKQSALAVQHVFKEVAAVNSTIYISATNLDGAKVLESVS